MKRHHLQHLMGAPSEEASLPDDLETCKYFHLKTEWLSCQHLYDSSTVLLWIWAPKGAATLVHSSSNKTRKRLAHDVIHTVATHADLVHEIAYTECLTQNDSTHCCVFVIFKNQLLANLPINQVENCWVFFLIYFFIFHFYWQDLWSFFAWVFLSTLFHSCT